MSFSINFRTKKSFSAYMAVNINITITCQSFPPELANKPVLVSKTLETVQFVKNAIQDILIKVCNSSLYNCDA